MHRHRLPDHAVRVDGHAADERSGHGVRAERHASARTTSTSTCRSATPVRSPPASVREVQRRAARRSDRRRPRRARPSAAGSFELDNIPDGDNIPVVITIGKWRRQIVIPHVDACTQTTLDAGRHDAAEEPRRHLAADEAERASTCRRSRCRPAAPTRSSACSASSASRTRRSRRSARSGQIHLYADNDAACGGDGDRREQVPSRVRGRHRSVRGLAIGPVGRRPAAVAPRRAT